MRSFYLGDLHNCDRGFHIYYDCGLVGDHNYMKIRLLNIDENEVK